MPKTITREELKAKIESRDEFLLVNVLAPMYFNQMHIPNSINVPVDELGERALDLWDEDDDIVVYCSSFDCGASPRAARTLEDLGFTNVADFEGGLSDWEEAGFPLHRSEEAA